ncbi:thermonuclease family protein [Aeoliella mucimassa]|uniref:Thermonuclease n=1 Tax=Aeoliella mucimassa TaxID=2527972 RepID=A0A518ALY7_9BACT|nr:thermonuclease family protein [Aeoliella mucimassa]QDU55739.1 Thermonuclease precursor [Aeoliella mucimassa]
MSRPVSRGLLRGYWPMLVIALLVVLRLVYQAQQPSPAEVLGEGEYTVERVVDGDTLLLANGTRVRLQGIDTPETVKPNTPVERWGPEASEFTKQFVREADQRVQLTFGNERLDRYGRQLAFVWNGDRLLNEELVRAGLARARLGYRYSGTMKRRLSDAEQAARSQQVGLWSSEIPAGQFAE